MKELTCEIEKENGSAVSKLWINFYTYEIDHRIPLFKGGTNDINNLKHTFFSKSCIF